MATLLTVKLTHQSGHQSRPRNPNLWVGRVVPAVGKVSAVPLHAPFLPHLRPGDGHYLLPYRNIMMIIMRKEN